ncbi:conserved transmembrane domain protein [Mycobacterium ulcerans str. Harvey]|uniref:Conserved transmembrane domain protein n=1 Tax=Mycobacterium ulcerans str. Harvey TaxID=1299332 RepID=A0ABP3AI42_MYCUL|nr:conserved transmembrane domain protein [Mycobacterium ulcerans str. Harvey]
MDLGLNRNLFLDVVHRQYFDHSVAFAILAGVLVVAAIAVRLTGIARPGEGRARYCWPASLGLSYPLASFCCTRRSLNRSTTPAI